MSIMIKYFTVTSNDESVNKSYLARESKEAKYKGGYGSLLGYF